MAGRREDELNELEEDLNSEGGEEYEEEEEEEEEVGEVDEDDEDGEGEDEEEEEEEDGGEEEHDEESVPLVVLNCGGVQNPLFKPFSWLEENGATLDGEYDREADVVFQESPDLFFSDLECLSDAIRELFYVQNDTVLEFPDLGLKFPMHSTYLSQFRLYDMHHYHTCVGNSGPVKITLTELNTSFEHTLKVLQDAVISNGGNVDNPIVLDDDEEEEEEDGEEEEEEDDEDEESEEVYDEDVSGEKRKAMGLEEVNGKRIKT
eukprot:Nk52_evm2s1133 gene=Nk52_evmTU2s1133